VLDFQQVMENRRLLTSPDAPPLTAPNGDSPFFGKGKSLEFREVDLEQALRADRQDFIVAYTEHLEFQDLVRGGMDPQEAEICEGLVTELELSMEDLEFILTGTDTNILHHVPSSDLTNACYPEQHDGAGKIPNEQAFATCNDTCNDHETHTSAEGGIFCVPMRSNPILVLEGKKMESDPDLQLTRRVRDMEYHF
jgi:hypothetical protein